VQHRIAPRAWYAGALEYVSSNVWGELRDEADRGGPRKGWLLADLDTGEVEAHAVPLARRVVDLPPISAEGMNAAELDAAIAGRVEALVGGIADQVVRLVVRDVPRHVAREIDHVKVRAYKAEALHFALDLRRPDVTRTVGVGGPGRRQTLPEMVRDYLERRPLPDGVDRTAFVRLGTELFESVEREYGGG
jgi:hypothetical protein